MGASVGRLTSRGLIMVSEDVGQIVQGLRERRESLSADLWEVAAQVAADGGPEILTRLVRLKADIEAVDFAINSAPTNGPERYTELFATR